MTEPNPAHLALDRAPGPCALLDAEGGCQYPNGALRRLTGLTAETAQDGGWRAAVHPDDRPRLEDRWSAYRAGRAGSSLDFRLVHVIDGDVAWVRMQLTPVLGPSDQPSVYQALFVEVTDLHRSRSALEEQTRLLQMTDAMMKLGHWHVHSAEGRLTWSDEVHRIHGTDPAVFQPRLEDGLSVYHPEDRPIVEAAVSGAMSRGEGFEFEARLIRTDGDVRIVRSVGAPHASGGDVPDIIGVFQDVTEARDMLRRLQQSEARYALAVAASQDGLWDWDVQSGRLWWSDRFMEIVGIQPRAFTADFEAFRSRLHPDDDGSTTAAVQAHLRDRVPYDVRYRLRHADGHWVWLRAKGQASWDEAGEPTRMVGTVADITAQVEAERAVTQKTQELERSNAELKRFASVASHDMKEPLRKIRTFADRIVDRGQVQDEKTLDYLERMRNAADRMHQTLEDLLAIARVPGRAAERTPMRIADAVERAAATLSDVISESGAEVCTEPGLPAIHANETLMEQVVRNLLDNALKYRHPERSPRIAIRPRPAEAGYVAFEVEDNGVGFEPKYATRIFGLFERLHGRSEYSGTGLGLALCQRIVEEHQGRIEAFGDPQVGARFLLTFPLPANAEAAP